MNLILLMLRELQVPVYHGRARTMAACDEPTLGLVSW